MRQTFICQDTRDVLEDLSKDGTQTVQEKMLMENVESHVGCFVKC